MATTCDGRWSEVVGGSTAACATPQCGDRRAQSLRQLSAGTRRLWPAPAPASRPGARRAAIPGVTRTAVHLARTAAGPPTASWAVLGAKTNRVGSHRPAASSPPGGAGRFQVAKGTSGPHEVWRPQGLPALVLAGQDGQACPHGAAVLARRLGGLRPGAVGTEHDRRPLGFAQSPPPLDLAGGGCGGRPPRPLGRHVRIGTAAPRGQALQRVQRRSLPTLACGLQAPVVGATDAETTPPCGAGPGQPPRICRAPTKWSAQYAIFRLPTPTPRPGVSALTKSRSDPPM